MRPRLVIDLSALADNYKILAKLVQPAQCAALVKARAYGLDAKMIAPAFYKAGCRSFFVHDWEEAQEIITLLPRKEIELYILSGLGGKPPEYFQGLIPVLNHSSELAHFSEYCQMHGPQKAALHIDTGLSRLGLSQAEWEDIKRNPQILAGIDWQAFISHLACSDEKAHPLNKIQLEAFKKALIWWREHISNHTLSSLSASGGIFLGSDYHFDFVRPGAALYGLKTSLHASPLKPVIRIEAPILQIRRIDAGASVGYGATHSFAHPGKIATLGIGYADGISRAFGNKGWVIIHGKRAPIIGRISMDLTIIDITHIEDECRMGDFVTLVGMEQSCDDWALQGGTIGYEILTSLGPRFERHYIGQV